MFNQDLSNLSNQHNQYVNSIIMQTLAGASLENNPKYKNIAQQIMTPSKQDSSAFNSWYNKQNFNHPYDPSTSDYNMYGFWKASQIPNSGASTQLNPYDNRIHYSDTYLNPNGEYVRLKMPWHDNIWTTPAWDLLEQNRLNNKDIDYLDEWNRQRLQNKYHEYIPYGGK